MNNTTQLKTQIQIQIWDVCRRMEVRPAVDVLARLQGLAPVPRQRHRASPPDKNWRAAGKIGWNSKTRDRRKWEQKSVVFEDNCWWNVSVFVTDPGWRGGSGRIRVHFRDQIVKQDLPFQQFQPAHLNKFKDQPPKTLFDWSTTKLELWKEVERWPGSVSFWKLL